MCRAECNNGFVANFMVIDTTVWLLKVDILRSSFLYILSYYSSEQNECNGVNMISVIATRNQAGDDIIMSL